MRACLTPLFNTVTAGIEVLVSGNKFLYACLPSVSCHVLSTFINPSLLILLKLCDLSQIFR
jgi:hypothetical protein